LQFQRCNGTGYKICDEINRDTDVRAFAVVGAHPAELSRRVKAGMNLETAELQMRDALKNAQKLVLDGKAVAIGEVGRPHYDVSPQELEVHQQAYFLLHGTGKRCGMSCSTSYRKCWF